MRSSMCGSIGSAPPRGRARRPVAERATRGTSTALRAGARLVLGGADDMACEHFEDGARARCRAVAGTLIPSHHERERYCRSPDPSSCPTRRLFERLRVGPVPQDAYYALWVPTAPPDAKNDPQRAASATGTSTES